MAGRPGLTGPGRRRDNQVMRSFPWPDDDGWPYPDGGSTTSDPDADPDEDLVMLRSASPHLFDDLDEMEREVICSHYGLDGRSPRSMKQLRADLGLSRSELRDVLGSGLVKLRARLRD